MKRDDDVIRRETLAQQVAGLLRASINLNPPVDAVPEPGQYWPGDQLPSAIELARHFGVSRPVILEAIKHLAREDLLIVERGRGTFVRAPKMRLLFGRHPRESQRPGMGPWEGTCAAQGLTGSVKIGAVEHLAADAEVAAGLEIPVGSPIIHRVRYAYVELELIQIQSAYMPLDVVTGTRFVENEKIPDGVYAELIRIGHEPVAVTEEILARPATMEEAAAFGVPGVQVLQVTRQTYDTADRCVEWIRYVSLADRMVLTYDKLPRSWRWPAPPGAAGSPPPS